MKNSIYFIAILVVITAVTLNCGSKSIEIKNDNLKQFELFLSELDKTKYYSTTIATYEYKRLFANETSLNRDKAFALFHAFYFAINRELNRNHFNDYDYNFDKLVVSNRDQQTELPPIYYKYIQDLENNGFVIKKNNDFELGYDTWITQNRNFISEHYYEFISEEMREYCTFLKPIIGEQTIIDMSLNVTPIVLAERIIWLENFSDKYSDFVLKEDVEWEFNLYVHIMFYGLSNTDIVDYETKVLYKSFKEAYEYMVLEYPENNTSKLIKPFYEALNNNNYKTADSIRNDYKGRELLKKIW